MNRPISSLHLAVTVTLTLGCARKPCDETKLEKVAAATGDRSLAARDARNAAIVEACPKLPVGLAHALEQSFASEYDWAWGAPSRHDDREYVELRTATCPGLIDGWDEAIHSEQRSASMFELCELERYGLLEPGEPFAFEDLEAYVLYEWLTTRKIDAGLARKIARGFMTAESSDDELMAMCSMRDIACGPAYERVGVTLPRTRTTFVRTSEATHLHVTADGGVSRLRGEGEVLLLAADASATWGTVAEALFAASQASEGLRALELLALGQDEPRGVPVSPGPLWSPTRELEVEIQPPRLEIVVARDALELRQGEVRERVATSGDCTSPAMLCVDPASLVPVLERFREATPRNTIAELRIDPDVAYQQVVWLLEHVRGEHCYSHSPEDECIYPVLVVDANPPLYRNMHAKLNLLEPEVKEYDTIRAPKRPRVAPSTEATLASFEAKREELLACVIADHGTVARLDSDSRLLISWGPLPASGAVGIAVLVGSRDDGAALQACVARVLGEVSVPDERFLDFAVAIELELSSPIRIDPGDAE